MTDAMLAITMGDAAGIGPEIILKALAEPGRLSGDLSYRAVVIGDIAVLRGVARQLGLALEIVELASVADARSRPGTVEVLAVCPPLIDPPCGRVDAACGRAAFDYIRAGIELAQREQIAALVTAPLHKEALAKAGIDYPGHTEILTHFSGATRSAMMLVNNALRVVLATIHCSLRDAIARIDYDGQLSSIRFAHEGARYSGVSAPRVAVAGLNPHAGEGGLFGREEIEHINPAIEAARAEGIDVSGPWPGDTVFLRARAGEFDIVVAQYHDQGLIPIKYSGISDGVNITLGLPFIRTSPDHGVAFDIAGKGIADPASLQAAILQALQFWDS